MIMVRFYFPSCTLNWVQARTRAPMGVCQTLSPVSKNGKGSATPDYYLVVNDLSKSMLREVTIYTGVDDLVVITLTYSSGGIAQLSASISYDISCDAVICGTKGELRLPHPFCVPLSWTHRKVSIQKK